MARILGKRTFYTVMALLTVLLLLVQLSSFNQRSKMRIRKKNKRFTFFAIGDFGGIGSKPYSTPTQRQVADTMAKQAELHNVSLIVSLGDNFYPHGVTNVEDPRFQTTFEDVYSALVLKRAKWLMVAGNHDYELNVTAQIAYTKKSHRWHFPHFYYTKVYRIPGTSKTVQIVMIDTTLLCRKTHKNEKARHKFPSKSEHRQWIKKTLRVSKADYLIVVGHNPILTAGFHGKSPCLESSLKPLLEKYNVTAYISGHDHNYQHIKEDDKVVNHFVSGNGNFHDLRKPNKRSLLQNSLKKFYGSTGGYTMFSASPSSLRVTHVNSYGSFIYSTGITPRRKLTRRRRLE